MPVPVDPVLYSIKVNGQQIMDVPLDVELRMGWGKHDMFFPRIAAPLSHPRKHSLTTWPDNASVEILWGRGADNMQPWYGYVNHHTFTTQTDEGINAIQNTYVVVGTSKTMNSHKSRSWQNVTPETIAGQIATEQGMRLVATPTNWILDHETQASESDFQFMNRLGAKVGRKFWVSGGTMYFIDPAVLLSSTSTNFIPQYQINNYRGQQDSARNFKLLRGDQLPGQEVATRSISGFDQTGQVITAQAGGTQSTQLVNTTRVARSYAEAQNYINASHAQSQFWLQGSVEVFGHTLLYPGKVIHLSGDSMINEAQGYWIVTGVRHLLRAGRQSSPLLDTYVTRCDIIRNTSSQMPMTPGIHQVRPEVVPCVMRNGSWQATQRGPSFTAMVKA